MLKIVYVFGSRSGCMKECGSGSVKKHRYTTESIERGVTFNNSGPQLKYTEMIGIEI